MAKHDPVRTGSENGEAETSHRAVSTPASSTRPRRILGIDPGLNITGYGVVAARGKAAELIEAGVVRGRGRSLERRLIAIYDGVADIIETLRPDVLALEELYSHYARPRTAILMGHARGVICLAASRAGIETRHYAATQIKKTLTGSGRAPKRQIQDAVGREFRLANPPEPPDVADALAIALCHLHFSRTALKL